MAIFPAGIPYSLQKPKNPYCRDFSLRVATLPNPCHMQKHYATTASPQVRVKKRKIVLVPYHVTQQ